MNIHFQNKQVHFPLDSRIHLVVTLLLLILILTSQGTLFSLLLILLSLLCCLKFKIPLKVFLFRFSESLFVVGILTLLQIFSPGIKDAWRMIPRVLSAVSVVSLFGLTVSFREFGAALSWFRIPRTFIDLLTFAYRYIFVFLEEADVIYEAQKNRLGYSNLKRGLNSFGILTGSLILRAFEHSQCVTTAMVQRGYDGSNLPLLKRNSFKFSELLFSFLFLCGMVWIWTK